LNVEAQTAVSDEDVEAAKTAQSMVQSMLSRLEAVKAEGRVAIQLSELETFRDSEYDFEVENGDSLSIPKRPNFVAVVGSVYSPSAFLWNHKDSLADYLAKSGGPTKSADDDQIYVIKANGEVFSKRQSANFDQMKLMPGDTIVVPEDLERVPYLRLVRDITDIVFKVAVTVGVLVALF
jgi:protein involved in polysaccharide export with SLBB domain